MTGRWERVAILAIFLMLPACGTAGMPLPPDSSSPETPRAIDKEPPAQPPDNQDMSPEKESGP